MEDVTAKVAYDIALAKVTPPHSSRLSIDRDDAFRTLVECLDRKLVTVEAPKGSARSGFLAEAHRRLGEDALHWKTAWLSVDAADGRDRLCRHVMASLRTIWPDLDIEELVRLYREDVGLCTTALSNFLIERAADGDVSYVLFVDDLHKASPDAIDEFLSSVTRYFPSNVHVVASGSYLLREHVDLAFYDEMSMFPQEKLDFTADEVKRVLIKARDFLFSPQTPFDSRVSTWLDDGQLELLAADLRCKTEGWPFGVRAYADALARGAIDFSVSVDDRSLQSLLNRFFRSNVFDELPEDLRSFVLTVALPDKVNADLCNALTGRSDSRAILRNLRMCGVFIDAVPNETGWFAFYPLFHRWLRRKQEQMDIGSLRGLCQRTSDWFEAQGRPLEAAKYLLMASDSDFIEGLDSVLGYESKRSGASFYEWVSGIAVEEFAVSPNLALQTAWSYVISGRPHDGWRWVEAFEDAARNVVEEGPLDVSVIAELVRTKCLELECSYDAAADVGEELLASHGEGMSLSQRSLLMHLLAESYSRRGRYDEALKSYLQAEAMAEIDGAVFYVALCRKGVVSLFGMQGKHREALDLCDKALKECPASVFPYASLLASKASLLVDMDRLDEAGECIERAHGLVFATRNVDMLYEVEAERALYLAAVGQSAQAFQIVTKIGLQIGKRNIPRSVNLLVCLRQAQVALSMGYTSEARAAVDLLGEKIGSGDVVYELLYEAVRAAVDDAAGAGGSAADVFPLVDRAHNLGLGLCELELSVRAAERCVIEGERTLALSYINRALSAQAGQGIVGPFLRAGSRTRALLHEIVDVRKTGGQVRQHAKAVLRHFDSGDAPDAGALERVPDPMARFDLTERECEVFELLDAGLSRREIAETLGVATNTVKSHVSRIYGKLGVTNRIDAFSAVHSGGQ